MQTAENHRRVMVGRNAYYPVLVACGSTYAGQSDCDTLVR